MSKGLPNNRIVSIDIAKAIAITLVVYGHVASNSCPLKSYVLSFHMPLFFILSGIFLKGRGINTWQDYLTVIRKRFTQLIIPYFLWACIYMPTNLSNLEGVIYGSWITLKQSSTSSALWFLVALFCAILIVHLFFLFCSKSPKHHKTKIGVFATILIILGYICPHPAKGVFWEFDVAIMAAGFMLIGYLLREVILNISAWKVTWLTLLSLSSLAAFVLVKSVTSDHNNMVQMCNAEYGAFSSFIINAILGCAAVIILSILIERISPDVIKTSLVYIGQLTLPIFVIHKFWREQAWLLCHRLQWDYYGFLNSWIIVFAIIALSIITYLVLNHFIPIAFGKENKK